MALVARSEAVLQALAAEFRGTAHAADLAGTKQVAIVVDRVEGEAGAIDVLCFAVSKMPNHAGI